MSDRDYYDGSYPRGEELRELITHTKINERLFLKRYSSPLEINDDVPGHRMTVVSRSEWGGLPPTATETLEHPIKSVVFAYNTKMPVCTNQEDCSKIMKELQLQHMGKGLSDIYYNFCIGGDGAMYEGRGWHTKPSKSQNYPERYGNTLVIGVIGDGKGDQPWRREFEIVAPGMRLVSKGVRSKYIIPLHNVFEDHTTINSCEPPGC